MEHEIRVKKVWFPSIQLETTLKVKRQEFIKICGDISKHSFSRLHRRAREIRKIFKRNGREVTDEDGFVLLDEFYEKFHVDIFSYHGSLLVEMLDDIRWGVQEYLQPEFKRSTEGSIPPRYRYVYPKGISAEFGKHFYRTLMNNISSSPYIKKFKTYKILTRAF